MRHILILLFILGIAGAVTPFDIVAVTDHPEPACASLSGLNGSAAQAIADMNDLPNPGHYQWDTEYVVQEANYTMTPAMVAFTNTTE